MNKHAVYIALGANLGRRQETLNEALARIAANPANQILAVSTFEETEAVGGPPGQPPYINGAASILTNLPPLVFMDLLHKIEEDLGRRRSKSEVVSERNLPRTIDLDILLYDDLILNGSDLQIPHPRMHMRHFVLGPLAEIAPDIKHPELKKTVRQLLLELSANC